MVVFVSHQLGNANANVTLGGDAKVFDLSRSASVFGQMSFAAGPNRGNVVSDAIDGNTYSVGVNVARPSKVML